MSDLQIEIQEYLMQGIHPVKIAKLLNVPLTWVYDTLETMGDSEEPDLEYGEEV